MIGGQSIGTLLCIKYVLDGNFSVGDYVMFGTYMSQLYRPVSRMVNMYRWIQNAYVNTENLLELLAEKPERADPSPTEQVNLPDRPLSMAVQNVSFRYQSEKRQILNNISFEIPAGQTWALVGESGCGKSTLSRLFTGFIEPQTGLVLINGINLNKIGRKQVRKQIATVAQDCPLFNASIKENINYARLDASFEDVINAANNAELKFDKFENGIESEVGERGLALSGGEKQRVAIARVLLKKPNAIILDEATSALDSITEGKIQKTLMEMSKGKTCLIIAHRLSTIVHADNILVISNGEILESGSHLELMQRDGHYARLWNEQTKPDSKLSHADKLS